jgi:glutaredoxin
LIVYSLPHCTQCKALKRKLESANIDYEEVINEEFIMDLSKETGIMTAPIVEVDGPSIEDPSIFLDYYQTLQKYGI